VRDLLLILTLLPINLSLNSRSSSLLPLLRRSFSLLLRTSVVLVVAVRDWSLLGGALLGGSLWLGGGGLWRSVMMWGKREVKERGEEGSQEREEERKEICPYQEQKQRRPRHQPL
jgi:hypothetical protein